MKNKIFCLLLAMVMVLGILASCAPPTTPGGGNTCTNGHTNANNDTVCDVCGATVTPTPAACTHTDANYDEKCDLCEEDMLVGSFPWNRTNIKFALNMNSNKAELSSGSRRYLAGEVNDSALIVQNVQNRNLEAMTYTKTSVEYVYWSEPDNYEDKDVDMTNGDDNANHSWGASDDYIRTYLTAKGHPDMYSTYLYDLMGASIERCFANLKTGHADNYFRFADNEYSEDYAKEYGDSHGYMMEFMESLTLSASKMYILASDYFIDAVRAFQIVPVNVALFNRMGNAYAQENDGVLPEDGPFADRTGDGKLDINDFVELIWDREWTYDAIMAYSEAVYENQDATLGESAGDVLGFVIEQTSGASASGLLYTSSITIIDKWLDNGNWQYMYPGVAKNPSVDGEYVYDTSADNYDSAEAFFTFEQKLTSLFRTEGVFSSDDAIKKVYYKSDKDTDLLCITYKFAASDESLLFGGFIKTGNLDERREGENNDFQDMRNRDHGGFAIAPGPLYAGLGETEYHSDTDMSQFTFVDNEGDSNDYYKDANENVVSYRDYQTMIHNVGRLGAISRITKNFSQCSAFLDYQSTHSTDILDDYYE